jgi:hypothetical protein
MADPAGEGESGGIVHLNPLVPTNAGIQIAASEVDWSGT